MTVNFISDRETSFEGGAIKYNMSYVSLSSRELVIQFDFESPMTITSEDEIEIALNLNEIDKGFNQRTSVNRRPM